MYSVLQLWSFGPQWVWEDHTTEMHRGDFEDLTGSHQRFGEASCVPWSSRARQDGRVHAAGKHLLTLVLSSGQIMTDLLLSSIITFLFYIRLH